MVGTWKNWKTARSRKILQSPLQPPNRKPQKDPWCNQVSIQIRPWACNSRKSASAIRKETTTNTSFLSENRQSFSEEKGERRKRRHRQELSWPRSTLKPRSNNCWHRCEQPTGNSSVRSKGLAFSNRCRN